MRKLAEVCGRIAGTTRKPGKVFPRIALLLPDKLSEEADRIERVREIYESQAKNSAGLLFGFRVVVEEGPVLPVALHFRNPAMSSIGHGILAESELP